MKKCLRTAFVILLIVFAALCPTSLKGAAVYAAIVLLSCPAAFLCSKLYKEEAALPAFVLGAFWACLFTLLLSAFAYGFYKEIAASWYFAALTAACWSFLFTGRAEQGSFCDAVLSAVIFALGIVAIGAVDGLLASSVRIFGKAAGSLILAGLLAAPVRMLLPASMAKDMKADGLWPEAYFRVSGKTVPVAFRGIPVITLAIGLAAMALFAF